MSASETGRRANASNAKRTANIMPIKVIARWANQGALREGMSAAVRAPGRKRPTAKCRREGHEPYPRLPLEEVAGPVWALWSCDPAHMLEPAQTHASEGAHMAVRLRASRCSQPRGQRAKRQRRSSTQPSARREGYAVIAARSIAAKLPAMRT